MLSSFDMAGYRIAVGISLLIVGCSRSRGSVLLKPVLSFRPEREILLLRFPIISVARQKKRILTFVRNDKSRTRRNSDWKCSASVGHQAVRGEKVDDKCIESGRIFDAARVTGFRKHFMNCTRNQRGGSFSGGQRVVVLAVDDEGGHFHRPESRCHISAATGAKDLPDRLAGKPWIAFDEGIQEIATEFRLGKIRS